jgi:hypothetical protein
MKAFDMSSSGLFLSIDIFLGTEFSLSEKSACYLLKFCPTSWKDAIEELWMFGAAFIFIYT